MIILPIVCRFPWRLEFHAGACMRKRLYCIIPGPGQQAQPLSHTRLCSGGVPRPEEGPPLAPGASALPSPRPLNLHITTVVLLADLHGRSWHFACTPLPKTLCIGDQHSVAARAGCEQEPETQLGRGGTGLMPPSIAEQDQGGGQGLAQVSKPPNTEESPPAACPEPFSPPKPLPPPTLQAHCLFSKH